MIAAAPADARALRRAVWLMLGATLCFAGLDANAKHLAQTYPVPMLVWARYTFHCLLMLTLLGPSMGTRLVATARPLAQMLRAVMLVCVTGFAMAGFARMPLGESTAFLFINPLLVAVLSALVLRERVPRQRWLAIVVGFLGALLIARPGGALDAEGIVWLALAALCYAIYQIQTRQLSPGENVLTMLFYTALVGTAVMSLALPWFWFEFSPGPLQWLMIASLGFYGGVGHFILIRAFRLAPASTLTPFGYTQLIWAGLLGWLVFGHIPDAMTAAGMAVIAVAGLWLALGERRPAAARG